jgi:peroxiredoxin
MLWIRFDEEDHYASAPGFCLPGADGSACLSDFYGDCNVILYLAHHYQCQDCLDFIGGFTDHRQQYREQEARLIVVFPDDPLEAARREHLERFDRDPMVTVLFDTHQTVRKQYTALIDASLYEDGDALLYILDKYGAPYYALAEKVFEAESVHTSALKWLNYIGMQCPE